MTTGTDESFVIPRIYAPRIPWMAITGLCLIGGLWCVLLTFRIPAGDVPMRYMWEGPVVRWVDYSPLYQALPFLYGLLTSGLCLLISHRIRPAAPGRILPPTPVAGFIDHLSRATAASLLEVNAVHFAYIGMVMQWTVASVQQQAQLAGVTPMFVNVWVIPGYLFYLAYSGWLLLVFNRDAKRGEYGDIAMEANALVPPSVAQPLRAGTRKPRLATNPPAPKARGERGSTVD